MAGPLKIFGVLCFGLAACFILIDFQLSRAIFEVLRIPSGTTDLVILKFAGMSLVEGWQVWSLLTVIAVAATFFIGVGIHIFSSRNPFGK